jgi:hypothetical protein
MPKPVERKSKEEGRARVEPCGRNCLCAQKSLFCYANAGIARTERLKLVVSEEYTPHPTGLPRRVVSVYQFRPWSQSHSVGLKRISA